MRGGGDGVEGSTLPVYQEHLAADHKPRGHSVPPTSSSPFPHHCSPSESRGLPSTSWLRVCLPSRFTSRQRVCLPRTPPLPSLSLQSVSVKGAAFHLMAARVEGYDPDQTLSHKDAKGEHFEDKGLAGKVGGGRQGGWGPARWVGAGGDSSGKGESPPHSLPPPSSLRSGVFSRWGWPPGRPHWIPTHGRACSTAGAGCGRWG